jgi:hypothetical protein
MLRAERGGVRLTIRRSHGQTWTERQSVPYGLCRVGRARRGVPRAHVGGAATSIGSRTPRVEKVRGGGRVQRKLRGHRPRRPRDGPPRDRRVERGRPRRPRRSGWSSSERWSGAARRRSTPGTSRTASATHLPRDDEPLNLVGALVDLRDLGVAHHALDGMVADVAIGRRAPGSPRPSRASRCRRRRAWPSIRTWRAAGRRRPPARRPCKAARTRPIRGSPGSALPRQHLAVAAGDVERGVRGPGLERRRPRGRFHCSNQLSYSGRPHRRDLGVAGFGHCAPRLASYLRPRVIAEAASGACKSASGMPDVKASLRHLHHTPRLDEAAVVAGAFATGAWLVGPARTPARWHRSWPARQPRRGGSPSRGGQRTSDAATSSR